MVTRKKKDRNEAMNLAWIGIKTGKIPSFKMVYSLFFVTYLARLFLHCG